MDDDAYKKMSKKCPLVVPVYSGTQLRHIVLDTEQSEAYLAVESQADYQRLQDKIKKELIAVGFNESEAVKYIANLKPMIRNQQSILGDLEIELVDTSGSIPNPRTSEQQEQMREAFCQFYSKIFGVDVDKVRTYFDVVKSVLNESGKVIKMIQDEENRIPPPVQNLAFSKMMGYSKVISEMEKALVEAGFDLEKAREYAPNLINMLEDIRVEQKLKETGQMPKRFEGLEGRVDISLPLQSLGISEEQFVQFGQKYAELMKKYMDE